MGDRLRITLDFDREEAERLRAGGRLAAGHRRQISAALRAALTTPDQPKDCGGSGKRPWMFSESGPKAPCGGCNHPDCPNRDQGKGGQR